MNGYLVKYISTAVISAGLSPTTIPTIIVEYTEGNLTALQKIAGMTPAALQSIIAAALHAYTKSFTVVYLISLAFGVAAIIAALASTSNDHNLTSDIARKLQNTLLSTETSTESGMEKGTSEMRENVSVHNS